MRANHAFITLLSVSAAVRERQYRKTVTITAGPARIPVPQHHKLIYLGIRNISGRHINGGGLVRDLGERGNRNPRLESGI